MRVFGFLIIQLLAIFYTACKTTFYFNEGNGGLKRAGVSDHRFDQGNQWWEQLIFVVIILFSISFALSNQITISKEMKRIMSPNSDETEENEGNEGNESEQTYKIMKTINTTGKILSIPSSIWKTGVAGQSFLRFVYKLLYHATQSKSVSLGVGGTLTALCVAASLFCNLVFFKKKPRQNRPLLDESTPLLENKSSSKPASYALAAHIFGGVLGATTGILYTNSVDYFPPHVNDKYPPLTSLKNLEYKMIFSFVVLAVLVIGTSTYRAYFHRLVNDWIPEQQFTQRPSKYTICDAADLVGSIFKAIVSSLSLIALTSSCIGLEWAILLAVAALPGNTFGEAATFLRKSPAAFVKAGRFFGIHYKQPKVPSKTSESDEDSAIVEDYDYENLPSPV